MSQEAVDSRLDVQHSQHHTLLDRVHVKSIDPGYGCTKDCAKAKPVPR